MFCPEGFQTLAGLENYLPVGLYDKAERSVMEIIPESFTDPKLAIDFLFTISPQDFLESKILRAVEKNAYICSPDGKLLKFDLSGLLSAVEFWEFSYADLSRATQDHPELGEIPDSFRHAFRLSAMDKADFVEEFNREGRSGIDGVLDLAKDFNILYSHQIIPMFYERVAYTITLQSYDVINRYNYIEIDEAHDIVRILRPFEGWSICVREEFVKDELASSYRRQIEGPMRPTTPTAGRPSTIRSRTLAAYQELFPEGHEGRAWLEVLRTVNKASGHSASLDTLKRAVKASGVMQKSI